MSERASQQVLAIDPGPEMSAWLVYDWHGRPAGRGYEKNEAILEVLDDLCPMRHLAIETVTNYGMEVGEDIFDTLIWIGRFQERWKRHDMFKVFDVTLLKRPDIKLHLCNSARAKDKNVRQALINRFGGSKGEAIGLKATPGPLYGITGHLWSALAVAVTWADMQTTKGENDDHVHE